MILRAYKYRAYITCKNNTAGIVGFQACGDEGLPLSAKQEAQPIASGVGGSSLFVDYDKVHILNENNHKS